MIVRLQIGDEQLDCACDAPVAQAMERRYRGFLRHADVSVESALRIELAAAADFDPLYARASALRVELVEGEVLKLEGAGHGVADLRSGEARLDGVPDLGAIDAMLRAILVTRAPERGALWLHGAMIVEGGEALILLGASGAGKSTASQALGGQCDELTIAHLDSAPRISATPYWAASPGVAALDTVAVLERATDGRPSVERLRGGEALRALAPHWVRYCHRDATERAALPLLGRLAARGVLRLRCAEGAAYVPSLRALLAEAKSLPMPLASTDAERTWA